MGTNYFWIEEIKPACACCGRPADVREIHLGKSSYGWCFSLHVDPDIGINSLLDWMSFWGRPNSRIEDEYEQQITPEKMMEIITCRSGKSNCEDLAKMNHAIIGPRNLLRHPLDSHCVGHGEGTWDHITGDFR